MFLRIQRSSLFALSTSLLAVAASAQSGGFTPGDLYFANAGPQAPLPDGGCGMLRIDPTTGVVSTLLDMQANSSPSLQGMAYDAFRDRIVFGGIPANGAPLGLWAIDAAGAFELLHADNNGWVTLISPASGGRVYYRNPSQGGTFRYVDATNVEHIVTDAGGVTPFLPAWSQFASAMNYDASTNALIVAMLGTQATICTGTDPWFLTVHKLPLSADGSRVIGEDCNQLKISNPTGWSIPCGLDRMPNGHLLVAIDPNASGVEASFVEIDPSNLALSVFAFAGQNISVKYGGYSTALGKAYGLDILTHQLRLHGNGGNGVPLATSVPISPAGYTTMAFMEIPAPTCGENNVALYCTAKTTSQNCVPAITTNGGASASAGSGFTLQCHGLGANKNGLLFYSTVGALGAPYQGGTLCVKAPIKRLPPTNSGGTGACSGVLSTDFNAWIAGGHDAALIAGAHVWGQFWFRDPGAASGTGLSGGVSFSLCN